MQYYLRKLFFPQPYKADDASLQIATAKTCLNVSNYIKRLCNVFEPFKM